MKYTVSIGDHKTMAKIGFNLKKLLPRSGSRMEIAERAVMELEKTEEGFLVTTLYGPILRYEDKNIADSFPDFFLVDLLKHTTSNKEFLYDKSNKDFIFGDSVIAKSILFFIRRFKKELYRDPSYTHIYVYVDKKNKTLLVRQGVKFKGELLI